MCEVNLNSIEEQKQILDNERLAMKLAHQYARLYRERHDYDDLVQAARLGILEAARTYDASHGTAFRTHAYNHARYAIQKWLRKDTGVIHIPYNVESNDSITKPIRAELPDHWEEVVINHDDPIATSEDRVVLQELLSSLTERQRQVVTLVYFQQYTYEEVAEELSISKQTAFATAERALQKLRDVTDKKGLKLADLLMG